MGEMVCCADFHSTTSKEEGKPVDAEKGDGSKDLVMFSVFDVHYGTATSHLLSKVLHPCLAYAVAAQFWWLDSGCPAAGSDLGSYQSIQVVKPRVQSLTGVLAPHPGW